MWNTSIALCRRCSMNSPWFDLECCPRPTKSQYGQSVLDVKAFQCSETFRDFLTNSVTRSSKLISHRMSDSMLMSTMWDKRALHADVRSLFLIIFIFENERSTAAGQHSAAAWPTKLSECPASKHHRKVYDKFTQLSESKFNKTKENIHCYTVWW